MGPVFRFGRSISTTISMDSTTGLNSCKLPSFMVNVSNIPFFRDSRELSSLPAEPLDRATKEEFKACGEEFIKLSGQHYLTYEGLMSQIESNSGDSGRPKLLHFEVLSVFFDNH